MAKNGNNKQHDNTEKKFTEFPKDLASKFQGYTKDMNNHIKHMLDATEYFKALPDGFKRIFLTAGAEAQKKIFENIVVYTDHLEFKITLDGQETLVPISRKNLLLDKVVPGSLETHNGMSYGKLSDNYIPESFKITKNMLEQMANLMPAGDYVEGKPNTAGYQLSLLLDVPVAAYSRGQGEAYENGMAYVYTGAKDDQGRHLKLWRYDDEDMETGGIDWHTPDELLPMRTLYTPIHTTTNHGASVASTPIAQINNSPIVVPASDGLGSKADFETIQGEVNFNTGMGNTPRVDIKNIGE